MKTTLWVGLLVVGLTSATGGQTATGGLGGTTPGQLLNTLGMPHWAKGLRREKTPGTTTSPRSQILNIDDGELVYDDNTQPCHLIQVKFVLHDGKVESWTRFVPVIIAGSPQGTEAPGSVAPPNLTDQELITRLKDSKARMSPVKYLVNWLGCSVGLVTDRS